MAVPGNPLNLGILTFGKDGLPITGREPDRIDADDVVVALDEDTDVAADNTATVRYYEVTVPVSWHLVRTERIFR